MRAVIKIIHIAVLVCLSVALFFLIFRASLVNKVADKEKPVEAFVAEKAQIQAGQQKKYDAIIVLGASVKPDRTPSDALKNRLDVAVALWKMGVANRILVTGDHRPGEYDEVDVMWEYLVIRNVPEEKIDRDYYGFSTYESMYNAANEYQIHNGIVVTQQYHLYRALYTADAYGMEVCGVSAANPGNFLIRVSRSVREIPASVRDMNYCYQRKEFSR